MQNIPDPGGLVDLTTHQSSAVNQAAKFTGQCALHNPKAEPPCRSSASAA